MHLAMEAGFIVALEMTIRKEIQEDSNWKI